MSQPVFTRFPQLLRQCFQCGVCVGCEVSFVRYISGEDCFIPVCFACKGRNWRRMVAAAEEHQRNMMEEVNGYYREED